MIRVGDKVVCIDETDWHHLDGSKGIGPRIHEVTTVQRVGNHSGKVYLVMAEYPAENAYCSVNFRKLHDETVDRIIAQVTEKPIRVN